jgi:hypothetical protein
LGLAPFKIEIEIEIEIEIGIGIGIDSVQFCVSSVRLDRVAPALVPVAEGQEVFHESEVSHNGQGLTFH